MKDSVRRCKETFLRVQALGRENFSLAEPTSFVRRHLAEIDSVITGLESSAGAQVASRNAWRQGALGRVAARAKLMRNLEAISRTARPMAENDPNLLQRFRMPHGGSDQAVLAAATAFATGGRQLLADFLERGMPENFVTELEADAEALQLAIARNIENRRAHVTATAVINDLCERGMKALRELDPYMRNAFATQPAKLAAWRSASRVERRSTRARTDEQPSAPSNSPAPTPAG